MFGSFIDNMLGGKDKAPTAAQSGAQGGAKGEAKPADPRRRPSTRPGAASAGVKARPPQDQQASQQAGQKPAAQRPVSEPEPEADVINSVPDEEKHDESRRTQRIIFQGEVLTGPGGALKVAAESRNLCVLFDSGLWLVSQSHKNSPLVTSVALAAKRQGYHVNEPIYVTPDQIREAYFQADRQTSSIRLDDNSIRRKIVETLIKAREAGANDIHLEAAGGRTKVEFRIDSRLRLIESWTQKEGEQFLSAVYSHSSVQSGATANWLEPQAAMLVPASGADQIALPDGIIAVRCQWMPLADGRYLDMRLQYDNTHIFGEGFTAQDVDSLGFSPEQTELVRVLRATPGCIRCVTGPVNQGKTMTLRVMLNRRMSETNMQLNCLLIEDPPEGGVIGARQIGVATTTNDDQRERTFIGIIRAALRLDPDIVMLGETRDIQTASFLFKLALSGRQVYTTLHVYSALAVPQRLRDIGIEPYLVYDHDLVRGMMCQRLMRGLCKHCRIPILDMARHDPRAEQMARRTRGAAALQQAERKFVESGNVHSMVKDVDLNGVFVENIEGCKHCDHGRKGRTVAAEVIETDGKIMDLLRENRSADARAYWLSPGGLNGMSMAQHALSKVMRGDVSPYDAEFEMGPLIRERELVEVEKVIGAFRLINHS